jgi:hypothetical protein
MSAAPLSVFHRNDILQRNAAMFSWLEPLDHFGKPPSSAEFVLARRSCSSLGTVSGFACVQRFQPRCC